MPTKRHSQSDSNPRKADGLSGSASGSSSSTRKKPSSNSAPSRTGQACDRCKNRKIRCDNTPGGCLPCRQNNTECTTTDRITHRATARGHTEALEQQNFILTQQIRSLEQQVVELGAKPRASSYHGNSTSVSRSSETQSWISESSRTGEPGTSSQRAEQDADDDDSGSSGFDASAHVFTLPMRGSNESLERNLGLSAFRSGTTLSLFEMQIDLAEFMDSTQNDPNGARSFSKLFEIITLGTRHGVDYIKADLPATYQECMQYVGLYLTTGNNFQPILHPPKLKDIVFRIYHHNYQTSHAETTSLHCILAWIKFQVAVRDHTMQKSKLNAESDAHYHYALSHLHYLINGRTIEDIQAMTLICLHVRNFPDSSTAWMTCYRAFNLVIEAGIHRKVGPWPENASKEEIWALESRKRVFWVLFNMMTGMSGKLGRPMPVRMDDFDCELPTPLNENLEPIEEGEEPQQCSYFFALQLFKLVRITNDIYNTIYAVRPSQPYDPTLRRLEQALDDFKKQIPYYLSEEVAVAPNEDRNRILALWLQRQFAEVRLVLHHPALCKSKSVDVVNRNLSMAVDAAYQLIRFSAELCALNGLDTAWYNTTALIAAIFTLLFSAEKRAHNSPEEMTKLQNVMRDCLTMCGSIGEMLGTGPRLRNKMAGIIDKALERISNAKPPPASKLSDAKAKQSPKSSPPSIQAFKPSETSSLHSQQHRPVRQESQPDAQSNGHVGAYSSANEIAEARSVDRPQLPQPRAQLQDPPRQYSYDQYNRQPNVYQQPVSTVSIPVEQPFTNPQLMETGPSAWQQWAQMACDPQTMSQSYMNAVQMMAMGGPGNVPPQSGSEVSQQHVVPPGSSASVFYPTATTTTAAPAMQPMRSNILPIENMDVAAAHQHRWPFLAWGSAYSQ